MFLEVGIRSSPFLRRNRLIEHVLCIQAGCLVDTLSRELRGTCDREFFFLLGCVLGLCFATGMDNGYVDIGVCALVFSSLFY